MITKLITLFKLGRKVAKSDILNIVSKFHEPPFAIKILFKVLSFSFSSKKLDNFNKDEGERLSNSLESMGTTFIKLGQFLATRPDIIGEELSKKLETLQDKLPPFSQLDAKEIIKNSKVKLFLVNDKKNLAKFLKKNMYGKKIVIGMGAGTISNWMRELPKLFK